MIDGDEKRVDLKRWLPTTKKELELRNWDYLDVIIFSGDAYVDHPSFGAAVIGRVLEAEGLRVAIVPQPNWRDDLRDFKKLGKPRLFFGVSAGAMDSMVNHYTANKRLRSDDAYTPDNKAGMRPDYPTIVYTQILKRLFPDTPVVVGGIEASMRRFAHYDYWQDRFRESILPECGADILIYGMGEQPVREIARELAAGKPIEELKGIRQTAVMDVLPPVAGEQDIILSSFEECAKSKKTEAENFRVIEEEGNRTTPYTLWQGYGNRAVRVNPPYPPMSEAEIDASFDLPYTRLPHPKYKGKRIPAYDMIRFSVNLHRGCFGGCSFCAIAAHQGKQVVSRSERSILREVKAVTEMPDFKGYISDLGGPSANMYKMHGKERELCSKCKRASCLFPSVCRNLDCNHAPLTELYRKADRIKGVKKSFIGSGIRYDMLLHRNEDERLNEAAREYTHEVICRHVSGRLKVAPEHTSSAVLKLMRKPDFKLFTEFNRIFDEINRREGLNQQLVPYFISSHPGCTEEDMAELAAITKELHFHLEQVQDFTPTPMTLSTEIFYTGINPYTGEKVYTPKRKEEKLLQREFFFWYKAESAAVIRRELERIGRRDLINRLLGNRQEKGNSGRSFKKPVKRGKK